MGGTTLVKLRVWFGAIFAAFGLLGAGIDIGTPVVVVYPLTATGGVGADTGSNIGTAIANKLVALGGLTVKPFIAGTARAQYLTAADSQGADYYITGYLTPLGSEVSVVEQVVSTRSGSIVFSTTAFAKTYADAVGPADALREAIIRHAGRGLASLDAPAPTASPDAIANASGVNISKAFGRRHKGKATPAPAVSGAPAVALGAAAAQEKALVIATAGTADAAARGYASASLADALRHDGVPVEPLVVSATDVSAHAADLCKANAARGFFAATLAVGATPADDVQLDVVAYDCHGAVTGRQHAQTSPGRRGSLHGAIDAAAARVANGFAGAHGPA